MTFLLCSVFFLSGIAALLFETLWFYQAGLALGNSIWASSLVLAGFMGGLAIGNGLIGHYGHRIRRPVHFYAIVELIIGVTGLALVQILPRLTPLLAPLLRPFLDHLWILNTLRFAVAFPLLLVPSTGMGATLPLLVGACVQRDPHFGRVLGRLYGWNTLGAMFGAIAGEAILFEWIGIRGTAVVAMLFNGTVALAALSISRRLGHEPASSAPKGPRVALTKHAVSLLIAAGVSGGILLALEVVWFRFLLLFVFGTSRAFSLMLSVILAGIGIGGLIGSRWLSVRSGAYRYLPAIALSSGIVCLLLYLNLDVVAHRFQGLAAVRWYEILAFSVPLMLPVSICSGILYTFLGEALNREMSDETHSAGLLTLANTTGATLGSLIAAFFLLPWLGIEQSIRLLAGGYGVVGAFLVFGGLRPASRRASTVLQASAGLLVLAYLCFPSGLMQRRYLLYPIMLEARVDGELPVATREGLTETIIYLRRDLFGEPLYYRLLTNSYSMSGTQTRAQRYMKLFVYLPMALRPDPRHVLLISYGVGSTAKALTNTKSVETIDVVDISKDILEMNRIVYPDPQERPLNDPRLRVHVEDGRFFLQTSSRQFDLITGEPPPPKAAGIVSLYTREYFGLLRERLTEGGMVTYWLPAHSLTEQDGKAIVRAFCDVFTDCSLWNGAGLDLILMGTRGGRGSVSEEQFARQWHDPVIGAELRTLGFEVPEQLGALFVADANGLQARIRGAKPLDDDHPRRLSSQVGRLADSLAAYRQWMDTHVAQESFFGSPTIGHFWPESLRQASAAYFGIQESINHYFLDGPPDPVVELPRFHNVSLHTTLHVLPLWLLGSDPSVQRVASTAAAKGQHDPDIEYHLGVGALVDHDYARAEAHFRAGQAQGGKEPKFLYLRAYALCMAGKCEEARQLVMESGVPTAEREAHQRFFQFLSDACGFKTSS